MTSKDQKFQPTKLNSNVSPDYLWPSEKFLISFFQLTHSLRKTLLLLCSVRSAAVLPTTAPTGKFSLSTKWPCQGKSANRRRQLQEIYRQRTSASKWRVSHGTLCQGQILHWPWGWAQGQPGRWAKNKKDEKNVSKGSSIRESNLVVINSKFGRNKQFARQFQFSV